MSLTKKGSYFYGESLDDLHAVLIDYCENKYPIHHFRNAVCKCGNDTFKVNLDENAGVAERVCATCNHSHYIGDSNEYLEEAEPDEMECLCESSTFKLTVAISLYPESEDIKWVYLGLYCTNCGCMGCYGDWKNEFLGYKEFLNNV